MAEEALKRTSLYDTHIKYGGKMVPFAGWEMPVQYPAGVIEEHMTVRTKVGLFDVSHMGEILLTGPDAKKNLDYLLTNDYSDIEVGQARYSPMCNDEGGCVDDLIVYCRGEEDYLIVVNASNKDKDYAWICDHIFGDVKAEDISDQVGQVALQGPKAMEVLKKITKEEDIPTKYYHACFDGEIAGIKTIMISTTGYTGEDGVEIYMPWEDAPAIWEALIEAGKDEGILPCGLGARDTLRLEAGMPLYGHEMDETITPKEAALGMFVKMDKASDFIGKAALEAAGAPKRRKVGLKVTGRGIVREHMDVYKGDKKIGVTCSGTHCPFLGAAYATALIDADARELGTTVEVEVRGRRVECEQVKGQFYKRA